MDRKITETFAFCPSCGVPSKSIGSNPFVCSACDFTFHFGPVAAVGGILVDSLGNILLLVRARDPGKGMFGLPGGFVDAGERIEEALSREIKEEVGLRVTETEYLTSFPNLYTFKGVTAPVADLFYLCEVSDFDAVKTEDGEVDSIVSVRPSEIDLDRMAFESNRKAIELYLSQRVAR